MGGYYNPILGGTFNSGSRTGVDSGLQGQSNNLGQQQGATQGNRNTESGSLLPGYGSLLNSGYSDQQKSAINQSTLGGINSSYAGANDQAKRRMAATGNSAGFSSFLGNQAHNRGSDLASQNLQNQKSFADETLRRKMMGLQGLQQMYGVDTSFLNSLNQGQNQLQGYGVQTYGIGKSHPGFLDSFNSAAGNFVGGGMGF